MFSRFSARLLLLTSAQLCFSNGQVAPAKFCKIVFWHLPFCAKFHRCMINLRTCTGEVLDVWLICMTVWQS